MYYDGKYYVEAWCALCNEKLTLLSDKERETHYKNHSLWDKIKFYLSGNNNEF